MDVEIHSMQRALADARRRYVEANPASQKAYEEATGALPGGNTRSTLYFSPFPLTMASGVGCRMTDLDGHSYLDLLGEYTAGLYGHNHPVIRQAIDAALDGGWNFGAHGMCEAALAQLLCDRFPSVELVRFTNSGTEANLLALATAVLHTGRRSVLVFDGAYHGSLLSFSGGGIPINVPHRWLVATYNDIPSTERLIGEHAGDLAAILVEPMLGSGGCVPADPAFLTLLRRGADDTGAVLIFDEVMTSRMSVGGMQHRLGISPDLTTLGKYLGGGMTFGAFGGRRELMSRYDPRDPDSVPHAGTFNNNVLSMAAGYAGLSRLFPAEASDALFRRGERLREELNDLCAEAGVRMRWTGMGSLLTAHFQTGPIRAARDIRPEAELRELFHLDMLERGCYLARRGMVALSLEIGDGECRSFCSAVADFLARRRTLFTA
ncbi:aspartate aminotransferase family protein [Jatrophihabitans sp.]|jgi:glutamate-1-semialdehyde 2,1-aminomutase|uniref:aspartate aminotransferase family protein n=1 Tax=Jatrophihabitans sp. TaxID=1932789 RepID=UPI002F0B90DF